MAPKQPGIIHNCSPEQVDLAPFRHTVSHRVEDSLVGDQEATEDDCIPTLDNVGFEPDDYLDEQGRAAVVLGCCVCWVYSRVMGLQVTWSPTRKMTRKREERS